MAGVTLDTGVFIALERKQRRALVLWKAWERAGVTLTVPAPKNIEKFSVPGRN